MEPLLSVVVCTHQREHHLVACLTALAALDDPVETIVVDSASDPPVSNIVDAFRTRLPSLAYIHEQSPGLSRARNTGLQAATRDIVAFVDDDAAPKPDWARRLVAGFTAENVACVGGACEPAFEDTRPSWMSDRLLALAGVSSFGNEPRAVTHPRDYPFGANIAFRRDSLHAVGGFDTSLGRTGSSLLSGEESAVVSQLLAQGHEVRIEPSAVVRHTVTAERLRSGYYSRRFYWQGVTRARMGTRVRRAGGLALEVPGYLASWLRTRDRYFLYRAGAETVGHFAEWSGYAR
jgi:glycosyltransferase involved in cell wall biosynthesis